MTKFGRSAAGWGGRCCARVHWVLGVWHPTDSGANRCHPASPREIFLSPCSSVGNGVSGRDSLIFGFLSLIRDRFAVVHPAPPLCKEWNPAGNLGSGQMGRAMWLEPANRSGRTCRHLPAIRFWKSSRREGPCGWGAPIHTWACRGSNFGRGVSPRSRPRQ